MDNIATDVRSGEDAMVYVGPTPWHGKGQRILADAMTAEEVLRLAHLDYTVDKRAIQLVGGSVIENKYATIRTDTDQVLGIVGKGYTPLQNQDAFSFFDALVGSEEAIYHTAGALGVGERVWILAKLPAYITLPGDDRVDSYVLISNSHDGSHSVIAKVTSIRVVCQNTLEMAIRGKGSSVKIRHTKTVNDRMQEAHRVLGLANKLHIELETIFNRMTDVKVSEDEVDQYVRTVFGVTAESGTRAQQTVKSVVTLFNGEGMGAELESANGTLWGAYNAVTQYVDHHQRFRSTDSQFKNVLFGRGASLKSDALTLAQELFLN